MNIIFSEVSLYHFTLFNQKNEKNANVEKNSGINEISDLCKNEMCVWNETLLFFQILKLYTWFRRCFELLRKKSQVKICVMLYIAAAPISTW